MKLNSIGQAEDSIRSTPGQDIDTYTSRQLLQDADSDIVGRAAKIHQSCEEFYKQLAQARKLLINQGFSAARPAYEATVKFADGFDRERIKEELATVERERARISDSNIRQALAGEDQDLKLLQNAESICLANFGLAELRAGRSAQGTIDLMQAARLNPLMLSDPNFQRHFTKIEGEIESGQNQIYRSGATSNLSDKPKQSPPEQDNQDLHKLLPDAKPGISANRNQSQEEEAKRVKKEWEDTVSNLGGTAAGIAITTGLAFITKGNCSAISGGLAQAATVEGVLGKTAGLAYAALASKPAIMAINGLASKPGMLGSGIATSILARYTIERLAFHNQDVNVLSPDNIIPAVTNYLGMGAMVAEGQKMLKPKVVQKADVKFLGLR